MSNEMDLDNEESSELSSIESELPGNVQDKRPSTRRAAAKQSTTAKGKQPAAARVRATKGRKQAQDDSADIAVPALDENGNLQEQAENINQLDYDEAEESESESEGDDDADEDFKGARSTSGAGRGRGRGRGKAGGVGAARGRTSRASTSTRKTTAKQGPAAVDGDQEVHADQAEARAEGVKSKDDFSVEPDNTLFNAVKDPRSAIEATVEDWLESYRADEDSRGQALADLVNFVLRCCGCNLSVDRHEAQDLDGVVTKLDDIQTDFAKVNQASYPLMSKSKSYKKFRASLQDFLGRLVETTAVSDVLYDDVFCETFQSWLVALSSSKLRAFRHTSTVITLFLVEALCEVSESTQKDFSSLQRQKEAEVKRSAKTPGKNTRTGATDKTRLKELEALIKATHSNKMRLETYFKEIFDAVFIHRYRDAEPAIRMECIKSLGVWMTTLPDHFLEGNYLRYIGWMLTDLDKTVRREAVASLSSLYEKDEYIGSMQHFTERFKGRLVEMATSDAELNIRVEAIQVLRQIDSHGLLDEDQRDSVAKLVFDAEARVRRSAATFFDNLLREQVEDKQAEYDAVSKRGNTAHHSVEEARNMLQWKCLATLLVKLNSQLDTDIAEQLQALDVAAEEEEDGADENEEESSNAESAFTRYRKTRERADARLKKGQGAASTAQLTAILQGQNKDRISLAVESLYYEIDLVKDWQSLLDFILLDHSAAKTASGQQQTGNGRERPLGQHANDDEDLPDVATARAMQEAARGQVNTVCRLEEPEETMLLTVLVSSIKTMRARASLLGSSNEEEREEVFKSTTIGIMNSLARLFAKNQTVPARCSVLLLLPQHMDLDFYLEMRQVTAYEQLWDDIIKQFVSHSDIDTLERAMEAFQALRGTQALSATNTEKTTQLENGVVTPLRQLLESIDANNATPLQDETIQKLATWLGRLCLLLKNWDVTALLLAVPADNGLTILEAIAQIVDRGQMGFLEEEKIIQHALEVLYFAYLWRVTQVPQGQPTPEGLIEERNTLIQQCKDFAVGQLDSVQQGVKRTAFRVLLDLHIAAKARHSVAGDDRDEVSLDIQVQFRLSGFLQAQVERYAAVFDASGAGREELVNENEEEEAEDTDANSTAHRPVTLAQHAGTYAFNDLAVSWARAICVEVLDIHHASTLLIHYDRFGPFFNECCRWLGDALRHYGVLGDADAGHAAADVAIASLKGALDLYLAASVKSDSCFIALSRHLANHIILRGKGFAIAARLPSDDLVRLHNECISYTIKKVRTLTDQEKHVSRNKALVMFKGLLYCLNGMTGKEAALIHSHIDKEMKDNDVQESQTSKHWDGLRAFDKRLVTLMSKDAGIKIAARKTVRTRKSANGNGATSGDEDEDDEDQNDGSQLPGRGKPKAKPKAAAQPKKITAKASSTKKQNEERMQALPTRRSNRANAQADRSNYAEETSDLDESAEGSRQITNGNTRAQRRAASPVEGFEEDEEEDEADEEDVQPRRPAAGTTLPPRRTAVPQGANKRSRAELSDNEDDEDLDLPPPLSQRLADNRRTPPPPDSLPDTDLSMTPASTRVSRQIQLPRRATQMSTQEIEETESLPPIGDSPPASEAGDLPKRKRSRF